MERGNDVKLSILALLVLASCAATKATSQRSSGHDTLGLPPVRAALEFPAGAIDVTIGWMVNELARLTGQELTMTPVLRQQLDQLHEPLEITTPVPADEVYPYVEGMLATQGVLIAPVKAGERPVLGVFSPARQQRAEGELRAVSIELDQVEALADHPALLCQVMLVFENVDSRQLQTQLRQLLVDAYGTKQCVPAGDRGLLLQAPGSQLLSLVRVLRAVDLASAGRPRAEPQPAVGPAIPTAPRPGG